jgi:hypothetical protein
VFTRERAAITGFSPELRPQHSAYNAIGTGDLPATPPTAFRSAWNFPWVVAVAVLLADLAALAVDD